MLFRIGKIIGLLAYYLLPKFRKRALSNLSLATDFQFTEKELKKMAKASLGHLVTTLLEYPYLRYSKNPLKNIKVINGEPLKGKSAIYFCGHQSNWELSFLDRTSRMPGCAIGRPIKNKKLYDWITKMRERYGGKMIAPKNAIKEGLRTLKKPGHFFGIVGDQAMPDSGFSSLFFGRKAWTSPLPALLAYRTGAPVIMTIIYRNKGHYVLYYSDPFYADQALPQEVAIPQLMEKLLAYMQEAIKVAPEEWLWIHNRWKQQPPGRIPRSIRYDSIAVLLPEENYNLTPFKEAYPDEELAFFTPQNYPKEKQYRFKLLFNLTGDRSLEKPFSVLKTYRSLDALLSR